MSSTVPGPGQTVSEEECTEELVEECNTVNDLRCNQVKEEDTRTWRRRIVTTRGPCVTQ